MPHLTVEYSANIENVIDISELVRKVHEAALATRVFELGAVRTRAARREYYAIADCHDENAFVAVVVRIAQGRSPEIRKMLGRTIFDAVCNYLEKAYESMPLAISLEVQEIDPATSFKKNKLHAVMRERATKAPI